MSLRSKQITSWVNHTDLLRMITTVTRCVRWLQCTGYEHRENSIEERLNHAGAPGLESRNHIAWDVGNKIAYRTTSAGKTRCLDNPRSEIENNHHSKTRMRTYSPEDAAQFPPIPQPSLSTPSPSSLVLSTQGHIPHSRRASRVPTHRSVQVDSGQRSRQT